MSHDLKEENDMKAKVLRSEYLSRRAWMTARCDTAETPDGRIVPEYYVLEYPDWAASIALTEQGDLPFSLRQYRHGLGVTEYELCFGVCDPSDASPLEAAQRELLEETGFEGGQWEPIMTISANPGTQNNLTHCFVARGVRPVGERHLDDTEDLTACPVPRSGAGAGRPDQQATHVAPLWKFLRSRSGCELFATENAGR